MTEQLYITSSSVIRQNTVQKNGASFFGSADTDLTSFLLALYQKLDSNYPRFYKMDNLSKLGWLCAEILLEDSVKGNYADEETGVVLSNANSSLDTDLRYQKTVSSNPSPSVFVYTLPNIVTGEICIRHHCKGESAFFIVPDFDAALLHAYVSDLFDQGTANACICGWIDVLEEEYSAALFFIEKKKTDLTFTESALNQIFNTHLPKTDQ